MATSMTTRPAGTLNPTRQQLDELDALLQRMLELPVHPLEKPEQAKVEEPAEAEEPTEELPPPPRKVESTKRKEEPEAPTLPPNTYRLPVPPPSPISYMVVETASPRPLPPASGFEPRPSTLTPKLVPVTPPPETPASPPPDAADDEAETWVPLRSTWQPSASTWPPLAESWHQANGGAPSLAATSPLVDSRPEPALTMPEEPSIPIEKPVPLPANETETETPDAEVGTPSEPKLSLSAEDAPVAVSWPLLPLVWFNQGFDACVAPFGAPGRWLCGRGRLALGLLGLACLATAATVAVSAGMAWSWWAPLIK